MNERDLKVIQDLLGSDFAADLQKNEIGGGLLKLNTNTSTDPNEISIALQVVPRAVLTYLYANLKHRQIGDAITLDLPFAEARLFANKLSADNYSGEITQKGQVIASFRYRSLPGVGLVILSTLELYDLDNLDKIPAEACKCDKAHLLQDKIEEQLKLRELITSVVDKRLEERDAIKELVRRRINKELSALIFMKAVEQKQDLMAENMTEHTEGKVKLKAFLDGIKQRREGEEIGKSAIKCPDCGTLLYKGEGALRLCVCYGELFGKEIKVKKHEDGRIELKFPKTMDADNIAMLLDALKNQ